MEFHKKKQQTFIVEIGTHWIKWVLTKNKAHTQTVMDLGAFLVSENESAAIEKIAALVKKYKIQSEEVITCLPRYQVTVRNLELPSTQTAEIKKIIDLQAVKQTPYTADEIVFDYYFLRAYREGYSSVMLVIAHRQVVNTHLKFMEDAGLKSPRITLSTASSASWVWQAVKPAAPDHAIAVLDVDSGHTDFFICQHSHLIFTQNLSVGSEKFKNDPVASEEKLLAEVSRSLQIYRSEEIAKDPSGMVLTGASLILRPLIDKLTALTGLKVQECPVSASAQRLLEVSQENKELIHKLSLTAVIGLAECTKPPLINLVPQERLLKESLVEKSKHLLVTGVLCISIFLVILGTLAEGFYKKQTYLKWLDQQLIQTQPKSDEVRFVCDRIKVILGLHDSSLRLFQELGHIHDQLPKEIYLTELNLVRDNHMEIQGRAESMTAALDFVNNLKKNSLFKETDAKRLTKRIVNTSEVVDFEIDSQLSTDPTPALLKIQRQLQK